jgi:hypothetical protein
MGLLPPSTANSSPDHHHDHHRTKQDPTSDIDDIDNGNGNGDGSNDAPESDASRGRSRGRGNSNGAGGRNRDGEVEEDEEDDEFPVIKSSPRSHSAPARVRSRTGNHRPPASATSTSTSTTSKTIASTSKRPADTFSRMLQDGGWDDTAPSSDLIGTKSTLSSTASSAGNAYRDQGNSMTMVANASGAKDEAGAAASRVDVPLLTQRLERCKAKLAEARKYETVNPVTGIAVDVHKYGASLGYLEVRDFFNLLVGPTFSSVIDGPRALVVTKKLLQHYTDRNGLDCTHDKMRVNIMTILQLQPHLTSVPLIIFGFLLCTTNSILIT